MSGYNYRDRLHIVGDPDEPGVIHVRVSQFRGGPHNTMALPASEREDAATILAGDDYRVVPVTADDRPASEQEIERARSDEAAKMQDDLRSIMRALGLGDHSRPYSPHECVQHDVLPAIDRLKSTANMPTWERELLAGQAAQEHIDALTRERDDLHQRLARAAVQAAGEYGPADIERGKADALRAFADTMDRLPDDWTLVRRDNGSEVTVEDLLRQTADRYVEQPYPILTQIYVDPKQPDRSGELSDDRPEPVDPASVRVGDVVEIEADDGSWMVRGEVKYLGASGGADGKPFAIKVPFSFGALWPVVTGATVRVLQPAEPEPEKAAVEALAELIAQVDSDLKLHNVIAPNAYALELVRRGVEVRDA